MPKFEYQSEFGLKESLGQMGMSDAFDPGRADFSGIDGGYGGLFITEIRHKTFISVDEEGTEAAAATGVVVGTVSAFPTKEIVINRPFIYLIRDVETGAILFIGRVLNPAG
jgi:serpin B